MSQFLINQSFSDFDVYNQAVKAWDLEFVQLCRSRFNAHIMLFGDEEVQVGKDKHLLQNGSAPSHGYTFAIHHNESAPFLWRYLQFEFNSIIVFPENRELHGVSQPGHHPFIITISEDLLADVSCALGLPEPEKFILKGSVSSCNPDHIRKIRNYLRSLCYSATETNGQLNNTIIDDADKWSIASLFLKTLANSRVVISKKRNTGQVR